MIDPYLRVGDKTRDAGARVAILCLFVFFFTFYDVKIEKIPFFEIPTTYESKTKSIPKPAIPTLFFLGSTYYLIVLLGLYLGEYAEAQEKNIESLMLGMANGSLQASGDANGKLREDDQQGLSKLAKQRNRNFTLLFTAARVRFVAEIALPITMYVGAAYLELRNVVALVAFLL